MSSLYIDRRDVTLKADSEALAFYKNSERIGTVPLAPLSRIFMRGDVMVSSSLLGKLGERGIGVVILSGRKATPTMLLSRPHNDSARRVTQYKLSQSQAFCRAFSSDLITRKINTEIAFLSSRRDIEPQSRYILTQAINRLEKTTDAITPETSIESLRGIEGAAAATYFEGYRDLLPPRLRFITRNRRPPKDPVNAILSLGYTLLHAEAVLALYGGGLDPFIGFYHTLNFGRESLACDVVEPLRAEVDRHTLGLFRDDKLTPDHFSSANDGCWLGKAGRATFYTEWEPVADRFRKELCQAIVNLQNSMISEQPGV